MIEEKNTWPTFKLVVDHQHGVLLIITPWGIRVHQPIDCDILLGEDYVKINTDHAGFLSFIGILNWPENVYIFCNIDLL